MSQLIDPGQKSYDDAASPAQESRRVKMTAKINKGLLVVAAAVAVLSAAPAFTLFAGGAPTSGGEVKSYGVPIFTSDGVKIGAVTATGTDEGGHFVLLTELGIALGLNAQTVAMPLELVIVRYDRVDLLLSIEEIRQKLVRAER